MKRYILAVLPLLCLTSLLPIKVSATASEELAALAASSPNNQTQIFDNSAPAPKMSKAQLRRQMLEGLDTIRDSVNNRYMPAPWKREQFNWSFNAEIAKAKKLVSKSDKLSVKDYQALINRTLNSTRDYHVSVSFYSTEMASLPFTVTEAGGRYFIAEINRTLLPVEKFPANTGDELIAMDGQDIPALIKELALQAGVNNVPHTDSAMVAARNLTARTGARAFDIPQGPVTVTVKPTNSSDTKTISLEWIYEQEVITPQPFVDKNNPQFSHIPMYWLSDMSLEPATAQGSPEAGFALGNKAGFLPALGEVLWEADNTSLFKAYIYRSPVDGKRIGFIRIPTYSVKNSIASETEFAALLTKYNDETDALVIDETNNPGGSVFYLYTIASMLSDKPLEVPKHYLTLTQKDISECAEFLKDADKVKTDEDARKAIGDLGGYPVDYALFANMTAFYKSILSQWNSGKTKTDLMPFYGLNTLTPSKIVTYTKPLVILTNELDFSGGDFFPAIMQDNKRAVIFGERTAGAGGVVRPFEYANNLLGIEEYRLTVTLAIRKNGQPIENLGVTPDVKYLVSPQDVQYGFKDYANALNAQLSAMLK